MRNNIADYTINNIRTGKINDEFYTFFLIHRTSHIVCKDGMACFVSEAAAPRQCPPHLSQLLSLQKIEQMEVVDAFVITTTGPLIQTNHILGIIVRDGKQVAELACTGLLIAHLESSLHIDTHIAVQRNKIDFLVFCVSGINLITCPAQLQINQIFQFISFAISKARILPQGWTVP